jgi:hypothetical protein
MYAVLILISFYVLSRALFVRIDYWDGYRHFANASYMLGNGLSFSYDGVKPPLLTIIILPLIAIAGIGSPGNLLYIVLPHFVNVIISLLSLLMLYLILKPFLERHLALLGTVLFATSRPFIRYASLSYADMLAMLCASLAVYKYCSMSTVTRKKDWIELGILLGLAALAKYPLVVFGFVIALSEAIMFIRKRAFDAKRFRMLVLAGAVALIVFIAVQGVITEIRAYRSVGGVATAFREVMMEFNPSAWSGPSPLKGFSGESPLDYFVMSFVAFGPAFLLCFFAGLRFSIHEFQDRDIIFLSWLVVLGGFIVFGIGHTQVRYLIPVIPPMIYFVMRSLEWFILWRKSLGVLCGGVILMSGLGIGAQQIILDQDPIFYKDLQRNVARQLLPLRSGDGRLFWFGDMQTNYPKKGATLFWEDEYWNMFHSDSMIVTYYTGEKIYRILSIKDFKDGDGVAISGGFYDTRSLPVDGAPPVTLASVKRRELIKVTEKTLKSLDGMLVLQTNYIGDRMIIAPSKDLEHAILLVWYKGQVEPKIINTYNDQPLQPIEVESQQRVVSISLINFTNQIIVTL